MVLRGSEPSLFSAIISQAWGLSLFKITVSITDETDNNSYMGSPIRTVLVVFCKIQSWIFNKGVVVKQLEISMTS